MDNGKMRVEIDQLREGQTALKEKIENMENEALQRKGAGRLWEAAFKLCVPGVVLVGSAMIVGVVNDERHDTLLKSHTEILKRMPPPGYLKESLVDIKDLLKAKIRHDEDYMRETDKRLRSLEIKPDGR